MGNKIYKILIKQGSPKVKRKRRGQVWIETVLYTFIAIALIGTALAFITPRITDMKDRAAIEQTIGTLNTFDEKVSAVLEDTGNRRIVDILLKRGEMYIDGGKDEVSIEVTGLRKPYSQPGAAIKEGRVSIISTQGQKTSSVILSLNYNGLADIAYLGSEDGVKKFSAAATSYKFAIDNKGDMNNDGISEILIEDVSGK